jgi:tetratricopeptide (TPR) repeat protein
MTHRNDLLHAASRILAGLLCAVCIGVPAAWARESAEAKAAYSQAGVHFEAEDYAGAIALYDQAIKADPDFISAYHDRGLAKLNLKDFKGALSDFQAILKREKNNDEALAYRGDAKAGLGDLKSALADYDRAIEMCPTCAYYYFGRGKLHLQAGDKAKAKLDLQEALDRNILDAEALMQGL